MQFIETLRQAFNTPDLRKRILFTVSMLVVFRIGSFIPVPGIDRLALEQLFNQEGTLVGFLDLFAGGALSRLSVFAMGVMPYINAAIIMQLLTIVVPQLEELSKEGEEGRKKITQLTRYGTVVLAFVQAVGLSFFLQNQFGAVRTPGVASLLLIAITLTAGTTFLMWIGEQINEYGIGNGISILIFASIAAAIPPGAGRLLTFIQTGQITIFLLGILTVISLALIAAIVLMHEGQRRIPVQYAKRVVGRKMYGGQSTHIPIKINPAGVIPVIFAASIMAFPPTMAQFIQHPWAQAVARLLDPSAPLYIITYAIMIIFFTYFYTAVQFNPVDVADNVKKYGGFVPGIRPGKQTANYLDRVLVRIVLVGAVFLAAVSVMPFVAQPLIGVNIFFGGVGLLILVGVALNTMKQIESQMMMRHYKGFIR